MTHSNDKYKIRACQTVQVINNIHEISHFIALNTLCTDSKHIYSVKLVPLISFFVELIKTSQSLHHKNFVNSFTNFDNCVCG